MTATPPNGDRETETRHRDLLARGADALDRGAFDTVRAITDEIFSIAPGSVNGFWLYLMSGRIEAGDPVFARIRAAAAQPGLPDGIASQLQFMIGKGYDDLGEIGAAFDAFVTANRLKPGRYDPVATRRLADSVIEAWAGARDIWLDPAPPRMVFVLGMPRSGSSLTAQLLGAHPGITNLGEQTALGRALSRAGDGNPQLAWLRTMDEAALRTARAAYLEAVGATDHPGQVLVDKMPENYWFAGAIPRLFPDALILHMRRDRRAIAWSCFRNDFREGHAYATDFFHILAQHDTHLRLTEAARGVAGDSWHEIALDALARDPEAVLTPVLAALDLDWHPDCARPARGGAVATLSKWQVRQGVDAGLPQGWRRYLPLIRERWGADL